MIQWYSEIKLLDLPTRKAFPTVCSGAQDIIMTLRKNLQNPIILRNFLICMASKKYINNKSDNKISIEAWDGIQRRIFQIVPEVRHSVTIRTL
jgi:hypothetical protein